MHANLGNYDVLLAVAIHVLTILEVAMSWEANAAGLTTMELLLWWRMAHCRNAAIPHRLA